MTNEEPVDSHCCGATCPCRAGDALTRRGLEDAWHAGQVLLAANNRLGPGWRGWLESCTDITLSRAEALMQLAEMYPDGVENLDQELAISASYMITPGCNNLSGHIHTFGGQTSKGFTW